LWGEGYRDGAGVARLLVDEHEGVAAVSCSPQLRSVRSSTRCASRWSPPLDILKIRLNLEPHATGVGWADPVFNTSAALDANSVQLPESQEPLDLDPFELAGEGELDPIGAEEPCPATP